MWNSFMAESSESQTTQFTYFDNNWNSFIVSDLGQGDFRQLFMGKGKHYGYDAFFLGSKCWVDSNLPKDSKNVKILNHIGGKNAIKYIDFK